MQRLKKFWPLGLLLLIELILFFTNYRPGTYLAGWDGLYPELNFSVNLQRNIFAIWQEYRGVGLYDGMSYASNFVHTLFLWFMSFVLPQDLLRYVFIFLMHFLGIFGMYLLLHRLLKQKSVALPGALFYGFNLGVVQLFYAPLEVFAIHFAFLPLLVWSLFLYLQFPIRKNLAVFTFLSFLATPQGFVPQIFISYLFLIFAILGIYWWVNRKTVISIIVKVLGVIFCINAFWLLPYLYGIPQNAPIIMHSKINQMASNKIYLTNKNRGNLIDVMTFKGFMLDTAEFTNQQYSYIMQEWRQYTTTPLFILPSFLFALLMLYGLFLIMQTKNLGFYPFVVTFAISFFFLGNDIWGLNVINAILRFLLPVFNEAFRFPFTKFETLFSFSYTILLSVGFQNLLEYSQKKESVMRLAIYMQKTKQRLSKQNIFKKFITKWEKPTLRFAVHHSSTGVITTFSLLLVLFSLPVFWGHFLFDSVRMTMEPEHKDVINFLSSQPTPQRIAIFPQPTFYNWEYYDNNYRGSGFLWYGIPQATLERSFDPWSNYNENYYWELSQALYSHNADTLKKVFEKYQVGLILLDEHVIYPFAPRTVQFAETKNMLSQIGARQIKQFGKVTLFALPTSPIFTADNLPSVNPYQWGDNDVFYQLHGNYIANTEANFVMPFRSLFTNRSQQEIPVTITESSSIMTLSSTLPADVHHVTIPSFALLESFIQANLIYTKDTKEVALVLQIPHIIIGGQTLSGETLTYPLFTLPDQAAFPLMVSVNNQPPVVLQTDTSTNLGIFLLPIAQDTYVTAVDAQKGSVSTILPKDKVQEAFSKPISIALTSSIPFPIEIQIPKSYATFAPQLTSSNIFNCNTISQGNVQVAKMEKGSLTLSAIHADACLSFFDKEAQSNQGYLLSVKSTHMIGEPLAFWAEDPSEQFSFLYTQLPTNSTTSFFIIPPREKYNLGYAFHLDNISTGQQLTQNRIDSFSLSPIPYNFLTQIIADKGKNQHEGVMQNATFTHPNPSLYDVTTNFSSMDSPTTIVLSQAYDPGWHAYAISGDTSTLIELFPFFYGKELTDHVKVNNWENGWRISNNEPKPMENEHIIIVFTPQYLEYAGLLLFSGTLIFFILNLLPNKFFRLSFHKK